jgi:hypothetical protein
MEIIEQCAGPGVDARTQGSGRLLARSFTKDTAAHSSPCSRPDVVDRDMKDRTATNASEPRRI